jgi:WD40 repeat protein/DNA-binding SARP family transcriptional activator
VKVRVLGPLEVLDGDRRVPLGGFRQRLVLGALLLHANRPVTTDWLIDAVWGDDPPRTARKTLQAYVARLRSVLGGDTIQATPTGYTILLAPDDFDLAQFEKLAVDGHHRLTTDPVAAARLLRRALSLWRGMPWGDLGDEPALVAESQQLRERRLGVIEDRITADLELGHAGAIVGELETLVQEHPFREGFRAQLMLALARNGRQAEALREYQEVRRTLGEELGIEPSPELQALEAQILLQDPAIAGPEPTPVTTERTTPRNPYKGLRPFRPEDHADLFGRAELIDEVRHRIERHRFVALVGASGTGKSSTVMAGVIPRLDRARWIIATMIPGVDPAAAARAAIGRIAPETVTVAPMGDDLDLLRLVQGAIPDGDERRLLLVIDQFEELLHQVRASAVRARFVRNLAEVIEDPIAPATILITLRADYFDRALDHAPLGELIRGGLIGIVPLRPHELEAAAARPAERSGIYLEPELIADLIADMTDQPGALPLFEYVLTELFDARTGPTLTRAAYRRLGGLEGALSRRAEQIHEGLNDDTRATARQILMRLVTIDENGGERLHRVERAVLESLDPSRAKLVLDSFDEARLLTFDRDPTSGGATVEVAHEALLREWPRMRAWVDDARDDLRRHAAFTASVHEWETADRDPSYLPTGTRLDVFDEWADHTTLDLTNAEQAYLAAGLDARDADRTHEAYRRAEELRIERRASQRLRALVVVVSIAALIAAGLGLVATSRGREAAASRREARARELANAALANAETDPDLAILLALEAVDATRSTDGIVVAEAEEALHAALGAHRLLGVTSGELQIEFFPDGRLAVGGDPVRIIDPSRGDAATVPASPLIGDVVAVAVSPDGSRIALGGDGSGWVSLHDAATGDVLHELGALGDAIGALSFGPDGRTLAALAPGAGTVEAWDTTTGDIVAGRTDPYDGGFPPMVGLSFDATGRTLARTVGDEVWLLDVASSEWGPSLVGHTSLTTSIASIPETSSLVTGGMDGTVRFWDGTDGTELASIDAEVGQIVSLAVNDAGDRLMAGGDRGTVRIWDLSGIDARPLTVLHGLQSIVTDLAFDPSGTTAAGIDGSGRVAIWETSRAGLGEVWASPADGPLAFSPDGTRLAVADPLGRSVSLLDTSTWTTVGRIEGVVPYVGADRSGYGDEWGMIESIRFSPDGRWLATTSHGYLVVDGTVMLWDAATGESVRRIVKDPEPSEAAIDGSGTRVAASACGSGSPPKVWDTATLELRFLAPYPVCGRSIDLSDSGDLVAVQTEGSDGPNVFVWNVVTGDLVLEATHRLQWRGAARFDPTGRLLLTAGGDGTLRVWNLETGGLVVLMEGHMGPVEGALWSSDGSTVYSAGLDGTVRLWTASTGEEQMVLTGLEGMPWLDVSPDGRWLATSSGGIAEVWALDLDELIAIAAARVTRSFSDAECVTYHFEECPG